MYPVAGSLVLRNINIISQIIEVDGVPITRCVLCTPSRLVECSTKHDTVGSILSTSVSTRRVIGTPSISMICHIYSPSLELRRLYSLDTKQLYTQTLGMIFWNYVSMTIIICCLILINIYTCICYCYLAHCFAIYISTFPIKLPFMFK